MTRFERFILYLAIGVSVGMWIASMVTAIRNAKP